MAKPRQNDHIVYVVVDASGKEVHAGYDLAEANAALPEGGKVDKRIVNVSEARAALVANMSVLDKLVLGVTKPAKKAKKEKDDAPETPTETPPLTTSLNELANSLKSPEADAPPATLTLVTADTAAA